MSSRDKIYQFGTKKDINDRDGHNFEVDYVFLSKHNDYIGFGGREVNYEYIQKQIPSLLAQDYQVIKEDEDFILLQKIK